MNVVMILSVINTVNAPLSYHPIRSIFTSDERYQQTLRTIESVRKHIPKVYIVLIEGSKLDEKIENNFIDLVDLYLNYSTDQSVYSAVNGINKSYAEGVTILRFLESGEFKNLSIENLYKLSGRYYLSDSFKLTDYLNTQNCFRIIPQETYQWSVTDRYYPVAYKIHKTSLEEYKTMFKNYAPQMWNVHIDMEAFLCHYMRNNVKLLESLGVAGNISVNGQYIHQ